MAVVSLHETPNNVLTTCPGSTQLPISSPAAYAKSLGRLSRESPREKRLAAINNANALVTAAIDDLVKGRQVLSVKGGLLASMATAGKVALRKTALKKGGPTMGEALHLISFDSAKETSILVQRALDKYHQAKDEVQVLPTLCLASGSFVQPSAGRGLSFTAEEPPCPRCISKRSYLKYLDNLLASMREVKAQLLAMDQVYS